MEKINYIQQNIAFFRRAYHDERLSPFHISLYQALFQYWNFHRFKKEFSVARSDLMNLSKVKSKTTYSKCLNELKKWQYLDYKPSNNPYVKSTFNLTINWTTNVLNSENTRPANGLPIVQPSSFAGQDLVLLDKTYKHKHINNKRRPVSQNEVIIFFVKNGSSKVEGQKFWNYYEAKGWTIRSEPIIDWNAAARKWILHENDQTKNGVVQQTNYLHTNNKKRYDEPL